jgi:hypothetical protein
VEIQDLHDSISDPDSGLDVARQARMPPSWTFQLRVAPSVGVVDLTLSGAITVADVRSKAARYALAFARSVLVEGRTAPSWFSQCEHSVAGAKVTVSLHHSAVRADGTEAVEILTEDGERLASRSALWFSDQVSGTHLIQPLGGIWSCRL